MCLGLCACADVRTIDGEEHEIIDNRFAIIKEVDFGNYLVYDIDVKTVFYIEANGYGGYLTPYQIYENGALYGAVYENGEIVPVPYAFEVTEEMIESQINSWFK